MFLIDCLFGKTFPLVTHHNEWEGLIVETTVESDPSPQIIPLSRIDAIGGESRLSIAGFAVLL